MTRAVIIGRDNPVSVRPEHALYPLPVGCTGWRLWRMLCDRMPVTMRDYVCTFDRRNLIRSPWNMYEGREAAIGLIYSIGLERDAADTTVLLLGRDVQKAFGLDNVLIHPVRQDGITWRQVPHPSGRNPWYNDPINRIMVGMVLEEMYERAKS